MHVVHPHGPEDFEAVFAAKVKDDLQAITPACNECLDVVVGVAPFLESEYIANLGVVQA